MVNSNGESKPTSSRVNIAFAQSRAVLYCVGLLLILSQGFPEPDY